MLLITYRSPTRFYKKLKVLGNLEASQNYYSLKIDECLPEKKWCGRAFVLLYLMMKVIHVTT